MVRGSTTTQQLGLTLTCHWKTTLWRISGTKWVGKRDAIAGSTEAAFLAAVATAKHARCMRAIMTDLGFPPKGPTVMHCDNQSAINMINARLPTERSRHIDIQHFAMQDWKESGAIVMEFISGVINPSDDLTKPLGWVLHDRHARRIMGHC